MQLAIVKKGSSNEFGVVGNSNSKRGDISSSCKGEVVLKNVNKKKKMALAAQPSSRAIAEEKESAEKIKWPPVSSSKSLPPLAGRIAHLAEENNPVTSTTTGKQRRKSIGNNNSRDLFSARRTIEFDVNQECEFVTFYDKIFILHCL